MDEEYDDEGDSLLESQESEVEEYGISALYSLNKSVDGVAKEYIDIFFADKEWYVGGEIPTAVLHAPGFVQMVMEYDIAQGVDAAYDVMEKSGQIEYDKDEDNVSPDVRIVIDCLKQASDRGIPKCFAAGLILMYIDICLGIKVPKPLAYSGFGRG